MDDALVAVSRGTASRLTGLTLRQLDYWAQRDFLGPQTDRRLSPGRRVRLYGFADLVELIAAAQMRGRGISLQHIRRVVLELRRRGHERPLAELTWATVGKQIYFQHGDGTWEGNLRPEQRVLVEVLQLEPIRRQLAERAGQRPPDTVGRVERRRGALGSKPVVKGTRIPVSAIRRYLDHGRTVEEILRSFPALERDDVVAVRDGADGGADGAVA